MQKIISVQKICFCFATTQSVAFEQDPDVDTSVSHCHILYLNWWKSYLWVSMAFTLFQFEGGVCKKAQSILYYYYYFIMWGLLKQQHEYSNSGRDRTQQIGHIVLTTQSREVTVDLIQQFESEIVPTRNSRRAGWQLWELGVCGGRGVGRWRDGAKRKKERKSSWTQTVWWLRGVGWAWKRVWGVNGNVKNKSKKIK